MFKTFGFIQSHINTFSPLFRVCWHLNSLGKSLSGTSKVMNPDLTFFCFFSRVIDVKLVTCHDCRFPRQRSGPGASGCAEQAVINDHIGENCSGYETQQRRHDTSSGCSRNKLTAMKTSHMSREGSEECSLSIFKPWRSKRQKSRAGM